jgi:hypothetical protein
MGRSLLAGGFAVALSVGCGGGSRSGPGIPSSNAMLSVSPSAATVDIFGTQQFTAGVNGSSVPANWQVNGATGGNRALGFISVTGLYVAPSGVPTKSDGSGNSVPTTVTITAVSQSNPGSTGSATVTILAPNQNAQSGEVKLGTSGGNANDISGSKCCGGTVGALITRSGTQYILSNTHVLAKSDFAKAGDAITQPSIIDSPNSCTTVGTKTIANLSEFFNLQTGPSPKIDAAIAQVVPGQVDPSGNILLLGPNQTNGVPDSGAPAGGAGVGPSVAMNVAKSGRTTGLTCSQVMSVSVLSNVSYTQNCDGTGTKFTVNYTNLVQVAGGSFSALGDSGSLIVQQETAQPLALLFAGSDTDTVGNPVGQVLNFFASGGNTVTFVGGGAHPVIGCSLPNKPALAISASAVATVPSDAMQRAAAVRDAHAPELLGHPEVQAVGLGHSYDNPREAAILFFVTKGQPRTSIPAQVDGVRTRIVEGELFSRRGIVSADDSAVNEQSAGTPPEVYSVSEAEFARAKTVHAAHADEQMQQPGVQGVGITSSVDAPGEAALMIFVIRGEAHNAIPPVIDGLRTRVRESSRFRAGFGDRGPHQACRTAAQEKQKVSPPPKN